MTLIAEKTLPPEDTVDIFPAIKVLFKLQGRNNAVNDDERFKIYLKRGKTDEKIRLVSP